MKTGSSYSSAFYDLQLTDSVRSAEIVVPMLMEIMHPQSVVDVGCGVGGWLAQFQKQGVKTILGLDGDWVPISHLKINPAQFQQTNLEQPFRLRQRFDLVMSLEVAEHLPEACASTFVESIVRLGPVVMFSAAVPNQGGTHHINEQWPEYWITLFDQFGYEVVDGLRYRLWNNREVCYWYRQNTFLFVDKQERAKLNQLETALATPGGMPANVVHPELLLDVHRYYEETISLRALCARLPGAAMRAFRRLPARVAARITGKK